MHKPQRSNGSWLPPGVIEFTPAANDGPDFGWALFQLVVQNIDSHAGARAGDLAATLGFLAGRIVQRAAFREHPEDFRHDAADNGAAFLRCDRVSGQLERLTPGSLASTLVESSLVAGARRLPEFSKVKLEAQEAMQRRGACDLRRADLSASPQELVTRMQGNLDDLLTDPSNRAALVRAVILACGNAVGYNRSRLSPELGAELAFSAALFGGWLDHREAPRR